jgi:hypothetical protein
MRLLGACPASAWPEILANLSREWMLIKDKVADNKSDNGEGETSSEDATAVTAGIACAEGMIIKGGVGNGKTN